MVDKKANHQDGEPETDPLGETTPPAIQDPIQQKKTATITGQIEKLMAWIWALPSSEDSWSHKFLRAVLRVHIIVFQEFLSDKIPLRASALTFIIILSMVPVLALGTSILKGLGVGGEMRETAHSFIATLETTAKMPMPDILSAQEPPESSQVQDEMLADQPEMEPQAREPDSAAKDDATEPVALEPTTLSTSYSGHLNRAVDLVFDYVDKTNFAALGVIGIIILLLVVFSVLHSIEDTMNAIWQTRGKRSLGRKMMDYLALMLIMPLVLNLVVAAMAILQSQTLLTIIQRWIPWIGPQQLNLLPVLAIVATFSVFYSFLPNTRVKHKAALLGGTFGGIGWLLIQILYFKLQIGVVNYNAIYGSFATLPLFLLWINISWMIFLAGAEVSFAVQVQDRYLWKKHRLTPIERLALAYDIVSITANDYQNKTITTKDELLNFLKQPDANVQEVLDDLTEAGLLRCLRDEIPGYVPSAPLSELSPVEIAELVLGAAPEHLSEKNLAGEVLNTAHKTLAGKKIRAWKIAT